MGIGSALDARHLDAAPNGAVRVSACPGYKDAAPTELTIGSHGSAVSNADEVAKAVLLPASEVRRLYRKLRSW